MDAAVPAKASTPRPHVLLAAHELQSALALHPELCLASSPPSSIQERVIRTSVANPKAGATIDARTCCLPFTSQMDVPEDLLPVIGLRKVTLRLNITMGSLCKLGQAPLPVFVRAAAPAAHVRAGAAGAADAAFPPELLSALFFRDDSAGGGWLVSEPQWNRQVVRWRSLVDKDPLPAEAAPVRITRGRADARSDLILAVPETDAATAVEELSARGGSSSCSNDAGGGDPHSRLSALSALEVLDDADAGGGGGGSAFPPALVSDVSEGGGRVPWLGSGAAAAMPATADGGARRTRAGQGKLLRGDALAAALAAHPAITLDTYNAAPTISEDRLDNAFMRTASAAPPGAGTVLPALECSAPFASVVVPPHLAPLIGLISVQHSWLRALEAWQRSSGGANGSLPTRVFVPVALPQGGSDGAVAAVPPLRAMLYLTDVYASAGGTAEAGGSSVLHRSRTAVANAAAFSGWLVSERRWRAYAHIPATDDEGEGVGPGAAIVPRTLRSEALPQLPLSLKEQLLQLQEQRRGQVGLGLPKPQHRARLQQQPGSKLERDPQTWRSGDEDDEMWDSAAAPQKGGEGPRQLPRAAPLANTLRGGFTRRGGAAPAPGGRVAAPAALSGASFPSNSLGTFFRPSAGAAGTTDVASAAAGLVGMTALADARPIFGDDGLSFPWPPGPQAFFSDAALSSAASGTNDAFRACCSPRSVVNGHMAAALALLRSAEEAVEGEASSLAAFLDDAPPTDSMETGDGGGGGDASRLSAYNAAPTLEEADLPLVLVRCATTPRAAGRPAKRNPAAIIVPESVCAAPMVGTAVPPHLLSLLAVASVATHLRACFQAQWSSGDSPLPVRVPLACVDDPAGEPTSLRDDGILLRHMLFIPDVERDSQSGWIVSRERWGEFCQRPVEAGKRSRRAVATDSDVISLEDSDGSSDEAYRPGFQRRRARQGTSLSRLQADRGADAGQQKRLSRPGQRAPQLPAVGAGVQPRGRVYRALDAVLPSTLGSLGLPGLHSRFEAWGGNPGAGKMVLRGDALGLALDAQPSLSLAAYNAGDPRAWLREAELHWAVLRCAATPAAAGAVIDTGRCSAPFVAGPSTPAALAPLLGFGVLFHLGRDVDAMVAARESPLSVLVSLAATVDLPPQAAAMSDAAPGVSGDPQPTLHTMLFIPDRAAAAHAPGPSSAGSGWLVPSNFLKRHRPPHARALSGAQVGTALSAWPELSLAAHNAAPLAPAAALPHLTLRCAVAAMPLGGSDVLDPALISAPFCGCNVPDYAAPAVGVSDVSFQLGRALAALRRSGSAPAIVTVPFAWAADAATGAAFVAAPLRAAASDSAPAPGSVSLTRLALVPDEVLGGGWLVSPERGSHALPAVLTLPAALEHSPGARRAPQQRPPPHPLMQLGEGLGADCDDDADYASGNVGPAALPASSNVAELLLRRVPRSRDHVLPGPALAAALAAHPHLSLAAYNAAPLHSLRALMGATTRAWLRSSAAPAATGATMDPLQLSAPILGRTVPARLLAAVGVAVVYNQVSRALAALRAAAGPPLVALVPFRFPAFPGPQSSASRGPPAPKLLPALWAPDPTGSGGFLFLRCDELMPVAWPGGGVVGAVMMGDDGDVDEGRYDEEDEGSDAGDAGALSHTLSAGSPSLGSDRPLKDLRVEPAVPAGVDPSPHPLSAAVICGPALASALAANPHLSLAAYNDAPTIIETQLGAAIMRIAATPTAGGVIDAAAVTAPFTALGGGASALPLGAVLGSTDCAALIDQAARALYACLRSDEGLARCVSVSAPVACVSPAGQVTMRELVFVPDDAASAGNAGGWLISAKQWARVIKDMAATAAVSTPSADGAATVAAPDKCVSEDIPSSIALPAGISPSALLGVSNAGLDSSDSVIEADRSRALAAEQPPSPRRVFSPSS